nr:cell death abnormality protein 1-like isoform X2 [Crassostrea gigas]
MIKTCVFRTIILCFSICYVHSDSIGTKPNGDCIFNSYKDGDLCRDCPTGYYGTNCTDKCKHPTFGRLCSETCDCSVCHHILGCISTAVNIADASTTALTGTSFTFTEKPKGDCWYNSYKDGDVCRDCPAGYYGNNCTDKCKHPTFGLLCLETCDCPVCNHIVGCISTVVNKDFFPENKTTKRPEKMTNARLMTREIIISTDCPRGYFGKNCTDKCKPPTFGIVCSETCDCPVCHHILGCISTTENTDFVPENKETKRPGEMTNSTQIIKLIIITTGSVITVVLLFFILFTMRIYFTSANVNVNNYSFEDVQVDNVYAEIR